MSQANRRRNGPGRVYWKIDDSCFSTPVALLGNFSNLLCRDDRDHVLAFLGLFEVLASSTWDSSPSSFFNHLSDGGSVAKVYLALARYQLVYQSRWRCSDVELLAYAGATRGVQDCVNAPEESWPSWLPD
jgi:hypothetical protein